jgi:hypothetical protein
MKLVYSPKRFMGVLDNDNADGEETADVGSVLCNIIYDQAASIIIQPNCLHLLPSPFRLHKLQTTTNCSSQSILELLTSSSFPPNQPNSPQLFLLFLLKLNRKKAFQKLQINHCSGINENCPFARFYKYLPCLTRLKFVVLLFIN